jgi:hypothetical protein
MIARRIVNSTAASWRRGIGAFFLWPVLIQAYPWARAFATFHAVPIGGFPMQKIDYAKLLGFAAVSDQLSEGVDFQDETISARLGAKVGGPEATEPAKFIETAEK